MGVLMVPPRLLQVILPGPSGHIAFLLNSIDDFILHFLVKFYFVLRSMSQVLKGVGRHEVNLAEAVRLKFFTVSIILREVKSVLGSSRFSGKA